MSAACAHAPRCRLVGSDGRVSASLVGAVLISALVWVVLAARLSFPRVIKEICFGSARCACANSVSANGRGRSAIRYAGHVLIWVSCVVNKVSVIHRSRVARWHMDVGSVTAGVIPRGLGVFITGGPVRGRIRLANPERARTSGNDGFSPVSFVFFSALLNH